MSVAHPPFNFGGITPSLAAYDVSKIAILPVAFDKTSSWMKGARHGPRAILDASRFMELYDIETGTEVYRMGIYTAPVIRAKNSGDLIQKVSDAVDRFLDDGKFVVVLGGEHSVSLGSLFSHKRVNPDLCLLHLDAHADARDIYEGNRLNHACVIARAGEELNRIVSVGIRSMDSSELENTRGIKIVFARDTQRNGDWVNRVVQVLSGQTVYVTIDVDVFDPGIMPSTGTPEPGGLDWYQVTGLLRRISSHSRVVGFDVVELSPSKNRAPDFLAAKLVYTFLSYIFSG